MEPPRVPAVAVVPVVPAWDDVWEEPLDPHPHDPCGAALLQGSILQFQGFQKLQVSSGFRCAERDCRVLRLLRFWFQMNNQRESLKQQAPVTCQFTSIFQKFVLVNQFLGLKFLKKHPSSIGNQWKSSCFSMCFPYFYHVFPMKNGDFNGRCSHPSHPPWPQGWPSAA